MDNKMIERVIKASFDCWNARRGLGYTVDDMSDSEKEFAEMHAIAIIKAMREPTEKMSDVEVGDNLTREEIWHNYIDAILND